MFSIVLVGPATVFLLTISLALVTETVLHLLSSSTSAFHVSIAVRTFVIPSPNTAPPPFLTMFSTVLVGPS